MTHTLKKLADIGAAAALKALGSLNGLSVSVSPDSEYWEKEEPARQAFAEAVKDAVEKSLLERIKELKAAHAAGKVIEVQDKRSGEWCPVKENHNWTFPVEQYRIKQPPVIIPLDASDIRATDEFRPCSETFQICTLRHADEDSLSLFYSGGSQHLSYQHLADNYLRRQHGSDEWKPCTKEISANK